ncbi:MAG TPA: hypothetical protein VFC60_02730 [Tissierellaceae bacterium]|nr:hypothetical protein [Tissierellaceae bacterium]
MIIHIGNNNYVFKEDIVAILDKKSTESTKDSISFINKLIEDNCIIGDINQYTKTYIIASEDNKTMLYTSNISSKALLNRSI